MEKKKINDIKLVKLIHSYEIKYISTAEDIRKHTTNYFIFLLDNTMIHFETGVKEEKEQMKEFYNKWTDYMLNQGGEQ